MSIICLPLVAALAGAVNVEATWRSSEDGFVNFAGYGYGGPRPDAHIKVTGTTYVGNGVYNGSGASQTVSRNVAARGSATFTVRLQNDGTVADRLRVAGLASTSRFKITYLAGSTDVTSRVVAGTYRTVSLAPGAQTALTVVIKAKVGTPAGTKVTVPVTVRSNVQPALLDVVKAKVTRV